MVKPYWKLRSCYCFFLILFGLSTSWLHSNFFAKLSLQHQESAIPLYEKEMVSSTVNKEGGGLASDRLATLPVKAFSSSVSSVSTVDTSRGFDTQKQSEQSSNRDISTETLEKDPCIVTLENKEDFHYEILESIVLRYPLPWHTLNCSIDSPVIFDVATTINPKKVQSEKEGWERYFREHLQGQTGTRTDGVTAQFGELVHYWNYTKKYSAAIGTTCDMYRNLNNWFGRSPRNFCVLHGSCNSARCTADMLNRSCFLNPMHSPHCFFLPIDLPRFPLITRPQKPSSPMNVCVLGNDRDHGLLASTVSVLLEQWSKLKIQIFVHGRPIPTRAALAQYRTWNVSDLVTMVHEPDFLAFQRSICLCHMLLPMISPVRNPGYFDFPSGMRKLTGIVPQIIANKVPSVMHIALEEIYRDYFTAPVEVYNSTESFQHAFKRMVFQLLVGQNNATDNEGNNTSIRK